MMEKQCALCEAKQRLTFHHLIPKTLHRNKWFRKHFRLQDMREQGITLCRPCHSFIHRQFSEKQLGREYNSLAALLADERVQKHVRWAKKQVR